VSMSALASTLPPALSESRRIPTVEFTASVPLRPELALASLTLVADSGADSSAIGAGTTLVAPCARSRVRETRGRMRCAPTAASAVWKQEGATATTASAVRSVMCRLRTAPVRSVLRPGVVSSGTGPAALGNADARTTLRVMLALAALALASALLAGRAPSATFRVQAALLRLAAITARVIPRQSPASVTKALAVPSASWPVHRQLAVAMAHVAMEWTGRALAHVIIRMSGPKRGAIFSAIAPTLAAVIIQTDHVSALRISQGQHATIVFRETLVRSAILHAYMGRLRGKSACARFSGVAQRVMCSAQQQPAASAMAMENVYPMGFVHVYPNFMVLIAHARMRDVQHSTLDAPATEARETAFAPLGATAWTAPIASWASMGQLAISSVTVPATGSANRRRASASALKTARRGFGRGVAATRASPATWGSHASSPPTPLRNSATSQSGRTQPQAQHSRPSSIALLSSDRRGPLSSWKTAPRRPGSFPLLHLRNLVGSS
jgi:hypothetical protein